MMALMGCLAGFDGSYMLRVAVICHTCLLDGQEASRGCVLQGLKTTAYWGMLLSGTTSSQWWSMACARFGRGFPA
jgi:hypothetical protein